jgi:uncharacterized membrane protein YhiD involved in acid resistance
MLEDIVADVVKLPPQIPLIQSALLSLPIAALLGIALGVLRPIRREIVPRASHVIQAQVLLAIIGAIIMIVVAESLVRAFAVVGAAGLIRYRSQIKDPKDAGIMLVALAVGLATGIGMLAFAAVSCAVVIGVLWVLESLEKPVQERFELTVESKNPAKIRPHIESVLRHKKIQYQLWGSSSNELHYEVVVPFEHRLKSVTNAIRKLDQRDGASVEWRIKKQKNKAA